MWIFLLRLWGFEVAFWGFFSSWVLWELKQRWDLDGRVVVFFLSTSFLGEVCLSIIWEFGGLSSRTYWDELPIGCCMVVASLRICGQIMCFSIWSRIKSLASVTSIHILKIQYVQLAFLCWFC